MHLATLLAYCAVAWLAILSPGPAVLLALRNGVTLGVHSVIWSSLGNVTGVFGVSAAAMLGLGVLLKSSALLFGAVKLLGAFYLFYIGLRHLFGRSSVISAPTAQFAGGVAPGRWRLYREAILLAVSNPKAILFFTALFPQFVNADAPILPQFFLLTLIFMLLSFSTLLGYAILAARARTLLSQPRFASWVNRIVGSVFISFGAALLVLRRPAV